MTAETTDEKQLAPWRRGLGALVAEVLGTFFFVWLGTGTLLATKVMLYPDEPLNDTAISIAFGFGLLVSVYALARVSGAHFNPAVSIALAAVGKFPWRGVPGYIVAQFVGGILAGLANWVIFGGGMARQDLLLGATQPGDRGAWVAVFAEVCITFVLIVAIMGTVVDEKSPGPLAGGIAIGLTVAAGIFATLPVSGGSFNPVRSLGPMIAAGQFNGWWIYILGPVVGAVLGAVIYTFVVSPGRPPEIRRRGDTAA